MIKLDDNLLTELGLAQLPKEEKAEFLKHMYETLEMRVGTRLAERMSEAQMSEFEQFISGNDEQGAFQWLEGNFPDYKDVVAEEFERLKVEIQPVAAHIVEASAAQAADAPSSDEPKADSSASTEGSDLDVGNPGELRIEHGAASPTSPATPAPAMPGPGPGPGPMPMPGPGPMPGPMPASESVSNGESESRDPVQQGGDNNDEQPKTDDDAPEQRQPDSPQPPTDDQPARSRFDTPVEFSRAPLPGQGGMPSQPSYGQPPMGMGVGASPYGQQAGGYGPMQSMPGPGQSPMMAPPMPASQDPNAGGMGAYGPRPQQMRPDNNYGYQQSPYGQPYGQPGQPGQYGQPGQMPGGGYPGQTGQPGQYGAQPPYGQPPSPPQYGQPPQMPPYGQ